MATMHGLGDLWSNGKDNEELPSTPLIAGRYLPQGRTAAELAAICAFGDEMTILAILMGTRRLRRVFLRKPGGAGLLR